MEQHPVPSHIASYEFRLVGDMTLRQFLQVAGGALVALLFYAAPLPGIIKWPAIIISGLVGTAFAFLPFEERPLSIWVAAFIKAIYSPTQYQWKQGVVGEIFAPQESPTQEVATKMETKPPQTQEAVAVSELEEKEKSFFEKVTSIFGHIPISQKTPTVPEFAQVQPRPQLIVEEEVAQVPAVVAPQIQPEIDQPAIQIQYPIGPTFLGEKTQAQAAKFEISAAPPAPPNLPNIVVGQVLDQEGNVIDGAILEIRDSEGRPVRALRTNKVGHFLTATPLISGEYEIVTEREGFKFNPVKFTATGSVIAPIAINGDKLESVIPPGPGRKKLSYPA